MSSSVIHGVDSNKQPIAIAVDSSGRIQLSPSSAFYTEAANYAALPPAADHTAEIQIVLASQGSRILFTFKDAGMYRSNGVDWIRLGDTPSYFLDSEFRISNVSDTTKKIAVDVSPVTTGTTRTITMQDKDGTMALSVPESNIYYVGKHGSDSNDGLTSANAFLTFSAAITAAVAMTPSASNLFTIKCSDAGIYTENITMVQYVSICAPSTTINGNFTLADASCIEIAECSPSSGTCFSKSGTTNGTYIICPRITVPDNGIGFLNSSTGQLIVKWDQMYVGANAFGVGDISTSTGHIHVKGGDIYLSGNNSTGIATSNGSIVGRVDHILETGTPTGTISLTIINGGSLNIDIDNIMTDTGFNCLAGVVSANVRNIDCTTAYIIAVGATLNLLASVLVGTQTNNGTSNVFIPSDLGSVNNTIPRTDGTTGSRLKTSGVTIDNSDNVISNSLITANEIFAGTNLKIGQAYAGAPHTNNLDILATDSAGNEAIMFRYNPNSKSIVFGTFNNTGEATQLNFNFSDGTVNTTWTTTAFNFNIPNNDTDFIINANTSGRAFEYNSGAELFRVYKNSQFDGEKAGTRHTLIAGDSAIRSFIAGVGFYYAKGINGVQMSGTKGFPMSTAGSIVGIACNLTVTNYTATGNLYCATYINGTIKLSAIISITANGVYTFSDVLARGVDIFSANDIIQVAMFTGGAGTFDIDDSFMTIDIFKDS